MPAPTTPPAAASRLPWPIRLVGRVVGLAAIGWMLWLATLFVLQDALIFPRDLVPPGLAQPPAEVEVLWHVADDGSRVPAWLASPEDGWPGQPLPALVFWHGNGEVIDYLLGDPLVAWARRHGLAVLLVEYRGYGQAGGTPSESALVADGLAFVRQLEARPEIDAARLVFAGRSLGGGIACGVAAQRRPAALILLSTFTSLRAVARHYLAPGWLVRHPFASDRIVPELAAAGVPILITHGSLDRVVPASHGRQLHALAPGSTYLEQPADHNDFPVDRAEFERTLEQFAPSARLTEPE